MADGSQAASHSEGPEISKGSEPGPTGETAPPESAGRVLLRRVLGWELAGIVAPVLLLGGALTIAFPGFSRPFNIDSILATIAVTAIVGLAQLSVLAIGHFNLALPAMGAFVGMTLGWLLQVAGVPWPIGVALALAFAAALGFIQGWLIVRLRLNGFIVTLGLASAYTGIMFVTFGNERFQQIGTALPEIGRGSTGPVPNILIISLLVCGLVLVLFNRTVLGRHLLATGASPLVAFFSAVPTTRTVLAAHMLSGVLAGAASIILVSRLAVASPAIGQDWLLNSFAAPVLGGTLLFGGKVSVVGTILGALLLAMIGNALIIAGVSQYWYRAGLGLIILGAVVIDRVRARFVTGLPA